jgi:hypothetical protein
MSLPVKGVAFPARMSLRGSRRRPRPELTGALVFSDRALERDGRARLGERARAGGSEQTFVLR